MCVGQYAYLRVSVCSTLTFYTLVCILSSFIFCCTSNDNLSQPPHRGGLGAADARGVNNPSVKNQRFLPPPFTQGRRFGRPAVACGVCLSARGVRICTSVPRPPLTRGLARPKGVTGGEKILSLPCCGARCAPWRRSACVAHRPLPLALVASSAAGGAPIAPPPSKIRDFCHLPLHKGGFSGDLRSPADTRQVF